MPTARSHRRDGVAALALCAGLLAPAGAEAGTPARSGNETLSLSVQASPSPSRGARLHVVIGRGTVNGQRSDQRLRSITVAGPKGLRYEVDAFPRCVESVFRSSVEFDCPARTQIGFGTGGIDARPGTPQIIQVPIELYNARLEFDELHRPRPPRPGIILDTGSIYASLDATRSGSLVYKRPDQQFPVEAVRLDLSVQALSRRKTSYVRLPRRCPRNGRWRFTATEHHYDGPTLKATHDVRCRRLVPSA